MIEVLDKGKIDLKIAHGGDMLVVNAARISFGHESWFRSIVESSEERLINYLAKNRHVSPFYHPQMTFVVKLPISIHRQWEKHKIGTASNAESSRYTEMTNEVYVPSRLRKQSKSNKQGSDGFIHAEMNEMLIKKMIQHYDDSFKLYDMFIEAGVAKEQARGLLPLDTYVTMIWTASLAAVWHFIELRMDSHAQWEIQEYARAMKQQAEFFYPISLKALSDHGTIK